MVDFTGSQKNPHFISPIMWRNRPFRIQVKYNSCGIWRFSFLHTWTWARVSHLRILMVEESWNTVIKRCLQSAEGPPAQPSHTHTHTYTVFSTVVCWYVSLMAHSFLDLPNCPSLPHQCFSNGCRVPGLQTPPSSLTYAIWLLAALKYH